MNAYRTISEEQEGLYREKGSKFISCLFPLQFPGDMDSRLSSLRAEHPKARHYCSAYRWGWKEITEYSSDDGEPSGSAGLPMLNQLRSSDLLYVGVVVVRYFGGTKLGIPGLIRAYGEAVQDALREAQVIERQIEVVFRLTANAADIGLAYRFINQSPGRILDQSLEEPCTWELAVSLKDRSVFEEHFRPFHMLKMEEVRFLP